MAIDRTPKRTMHETTMKPKQEIRSSVRDLEPKSNSERTHRHKSPLKAIESSFEGEGCGGRAKKKQEARIKRRERRRRERKRRRREEKRQDKGAALRRDGDGLDT